MIDYQVTGARRLLLFACIWAIGYLPAGAHGERMSYLDNGTTKIGVDLDLGGSITYLSKSDGANLINSHDLGRQIQQSYYSGPQPYGKAHPGWKNWPWNPIGSGDCYDNRSQVTEHTNDGNILHVETIPMQWALKNVPGECSFDTSIRLEQNTAIVRCRLNNRRKDKTQYPARDQELPAVYTIGKLYKLFTYDGEAPFTGAPLKEIVNAGPPWANWKATESWAALVDDKGFGVGVVHPGVYTFIGGFAGTKNRGGPKSSSTGYISPVRQEILDYNIGYEYQYTLVLGDVPTIRKYAVEHRIAETRPDYEFTKDRQHWTYSGATDAGMPLKGGLRIKLGKNNPHLIGPEQWWNAETMPKLYIKAAFRTRKGKGEVYWRVPGKDFADDRRVEFDIVADNKPRVYEIDLAGAPGYKGTITGLRIDPVVEGIYGDEVRIESISWKPPSAQGSSSSAGVDRQKPAR